MTQATKERASPAESQEDTVQQMADTLIEQAVIARQNGDKATAARLMRAAATITDDAELDDLPRGDRPDGRKQTTPETEKIKDMMRKGWTEAHEMQTATGLNANRVHSLLGRLKNSRELKFEKRTITQYRLLP